MAILASPFAPHRLIFDIRGLMAEEYVDAGRWANGGLAFRMIKYVERAAMLRAVETMQLQSILCTDTRRSCMINNVLYDEGGIINGFLSETMAIGVEANYLQPQILQQYGDRGLQDRVLPAINRYFWNASLNFSYVPIYGKFALFNRYIFQWEAYIEAGLGAMESQWISRDPADANATNFLVQGHIGLGTRLFLTKWLVIHAYLKDYLFADKFEPANRSMYGTAVPLKYSWNRAKNSPVALFAQVSFSA